MIRTRFLLPFFVLFTAACGSSGSGDDGSAGASGSAGTGGGSAGTGGGSAGTGGGSAGTGGSSGAGGMPMMDAGPDAFMPQPTVLEGPVTGGNGIFVAGTFYDLGTVGYEQNEYFLSGTAEGYTNVGDLGSDGVWTVEPDGQANYKTRIVVIRPTDAVDFNGTVVVEWLNVSGGLDAAPDWIQGHVEMIRSGYVWVGVSAQKTGVEGGGGLLMLPGVDDPGLKLIDPARYSSLSHPGDSYSYDIFTKVAEVLRTPGNVDALGGLTPMQVLGVGQSQSAFRLVTYVNGIQPLKQMYDGFLVHGRGNGSAPLSQDPQPAIDPPNSVLIRDDTQVPVLTLQTETDLLFLGSVADRQPDSATFRLWEVAGTAHADGYTLGGGMFDAGDDPTVYQVQELTDPLSRITNVPLGMVPSIVCDLPVNDGPQHFAVKAAIHALNEWVTAGTAPAMAPRLEVTGMPPAFVLDQHGNVQGGIRTPYVDVPTSTLSGLGQMAPFLCLLSGTTANFDATKLAMLYPTHDDYVNAVNASADQAVTDGFLLQADADLIKAAAAASNIGN